MIASGGGNCRRVEFGRVYADYRMLLQLGTQTGYGCPAMTVSVADPDDFHGWWGSYSGRGNIELRATPTHSPKLSHYDVNGYMVLTVPDAGTSASVESLYRSGALRKNGDGELVVCQGAGCGSRIYCATGSVTLVGLSDAVYQGGLPKAWLHLDATRRDTMVTFEKDGRECLARWNDCDGGSVYATTNFPAERLGQSSTIPYVYPPFISASTSPSGKALVDFGMTDLDVTSGLPSNCVMTTSEQLSKAKEFFFAARSSSTHTSRNSRALIGAVGTSQYLGYGHTHVFNTYSANETLVASRHVTFNGMQVHPLGLGAENSRFSTRYGDMPRDFSVISFGSEAELKFDLIGSDGGYIERTGGWQLGELLVYDRTLTPEERVKINRYLMEKWQKDSRPDEAGEVVLNDNTSVSVPAGHTARIKSLSTMGTKIVKKGEGRLIVDGIAPAGAKLDVQGGSVVITTPEVALQPAANPYFWIDATNTASLVMSPDNKPGENQYITRWNDCNGGSVYAELPLEEYPAVGSSTQKNIYLIDDRFTGNKPWVVKGASPTGLDMVNFGKLSNKTQSFMQLQPHNVANAYCGFIVVKALEAGLAKQYFGSASTDLLQLNWHRLGNESYTHKDILAAAWTVDGRAMDPLADADAVIVTTNCLVVAFANESSKVRADLLSKYTYNQEGSGGQMIGEMLLYDRPLSAEERRNTEAYLMKKWLGKDHPESVAGSRVTYKYPSDKPVVVDTGANGAVSVEGGNREFVKRGNGATSFEDLAVVSNFVSFAAEGGSLAVTLDIPDDAFYRYDANDVDSFTSTYFTDDGNGGLVTNILKWADQVSGRIAQSAHIDGFSGKYAGYSGGTCTNPTLTAVAMPDGVARPTVDFGEYNNVAWIWKDITSPVPLGTFNSSSGFSLADYGNTTTYGFKEVHAVYADRPKDDGSGTETRTMVFTALSANPLTLKTEGNLWRGSAGALFSESDGKFVSEGVIHLDGEAVPASTKLGEGFHLVSIQPTNKVNVSAIALDRNCNAGGCYISEYVAYKEPHTPEVFAYVESKLMRKWFGTAAERPLWLTPLTTLAAAAGSTLTLTTEAKVQVNELAGAGTIVAPELVGVSSLALVHPTDTLTASGAVTLNGAGGTVSFSEGLTNLEAGSYTVFSAGTLLNEAAILNWTLDADVPCNRHVALSVVGNDVVLKVEKVGFVLIVR